jgi:predicted nucleic acid-binding protein
MGQIVLTDATPVMYLAQVEDGLSWLKEIFGWVAMTSTVRGELLPIRDVPGKIAIKRALGNGILREIEDPWSTPKFPQLGPGEESTIRAGINLSRLGNSCLILIDDKDGRRLLKTVSSETLAVSGTIAVVGRAKRLDLIPSAASVFEKLRRLGFRVSDDLVRSILDRVGETSEPWPPGRRRTAARKARLQRHTDRS